MANKDTTQLLLQAAMTGASLAPIGLWSVPVIGVASIAMNLIQGHAMRRAAKDTQRQYREAATDTERIGTQQQLAQEQRAVSQYRTQRAMGDERAGDLYSRSMEIGFKQRDYASQRASELRSQAAQIAVPSKGRITEGALTTGLVEAAKEGVTTWAGAAMAKKYDDRLLTLAGSEDASLGMKDRLLTPWKKDTAMETLPSLLQEKTVPVIPIDYDPNRNKKPIDISPSRYWG